MLVLSMQHLICCLAIGSVGVFITCLADNKLLPAFISQAHLSHCHSLQ